MSRSSVPPLMSESFEAPYPPDDPTDNNGMAYDTVVRRWPIIITGIVDQLHRACHVLSLESQTNGLETQTLKDKLAESKNIIEKIGKLKYHMGRDHALEIIPEDGEPLADAYNAELKRLTDMGKGTWFTAPWLYSECYLYRLLRSFFASTVHWRDHDPFFEQKMSTFSHSGKSILNIARSVHELDIEPNLLDGEKLEILFREMVQICLWGNATDLSLLTHLAPSEIERLQTVGKDAQEARKHFILKDDQSPLWHHVSGLKGGRSDFILDNAGFELFTDLVLADFLVTYTPYISKVVFHPKLIPWFVSDVTPPDFEKTITSLSDPAFFSHLIDFNDKDFQSNLEHLTRLCTRWKSYIDRGIFSLSVPLDTPLGDSKAAALAEFWTGPWPYWRLETHAPELYKGLKGSDLVIFKGDLNYRKLTGDVLWPAWTPFASALGPLAGSFPLLSLRTNKATVVVGVDKEVAEELDKGKEKWRSDGRYALVSFLDASRS